MKKVLMLLALIIGAVVGYAQSAYLVSNNPAIYPGGNAIIELWLDGVYGTVDTLDFTVKDKSTGVNHSYTTTNIPCLIEVNPSETTVYRLTSVVNRYNTVEIDTLRWECTVYVEGQDGVIVYFNPPDVCNQQEEVYLNLYFSSNVVGDITYEGDGVEGQVLKPWMLQTGPHFITAHLWYNGVDHPKTGWFNVTPCGGTWIDEETNEDFISVSPNPTNGFLRFSVPCFVEIYNAAGMRVKAYNDMVQELDISNLPTNLYILCLHLEDGTITMLRVVKD